MWEIWLLQTLEGWILWDAPGSLPGVGEQREPKAVSKAWREANLHTQLMGERLEELITGGDNCTPCQKAAGSRASREGALGAGGAGKVWG